MIPRLQRFYGGSLEGWLRTPAKWLQAYGSMVRVIRAEEALHLVRVIAAGAGTLKKDQSRRVMNTWSRDASRHPTEVLKRRKKKKGPMPDFRSMGIGYTYVGRKRG